MDTASGSTARGDRADRECLAARSLALLHPALVGPGLLALVGDDASTRTILYAGADHFAAAHVTLTRGLQAGSGDHGGARVVADRSRIVLAYGFVQAEREVAAIAA